MTTPTPDRPTQPPAVPDELLVQWINEATAEGSFEPIYSRALARRVNDWAWSQREALADEEVRQAEQRGAEAELEACCEWLCSEDILEPAIDALRAARRPAPPTLREQALAALYTRLNDHPNPLDEVRISMELAIRALQEGADG